MLTKRIYLCIIDADALINAFLWHGRIAQLGEHLPYKQRVIGSSPIVPTILFLTGTAYGNKFITYCKR